VHVHALVFGGYVPQPELQNLWTEVLGEELAIVHITAVRGDLRDAVREVLKYATKGHGNVFDQARHAAAVEYAFRQVRRISVGGALRTINPGDAAFEDATPSELSVTLLEEKNGGTATQARPCEACGAPGPWELIEFASAFEVDVNGGFGLVRKTERATAPPRREAIDSLRAEVE
jgi:hypothetical protein